MKDLNYYLDLNYDLRIRRLAPEEGSGWFIEIPLLPGCVSDGETIEEALENIEDAKAAWISTALELGRKIPEPVDEEYSGQLRLRMPKSLHKVLAEKAREERISLNQLIVYELARSAGYYSRDKR